LVGGVLGFARQEALKYVLDTHVVVRWHLDSPKLSKAHRRILRDTEKRVARVGVSAISLWEIAKLVEMRKLTLAQSLEECLARIETSPFVDVLPLTASIATESVRLGTKAPRDPADQLIIATARCHGATLLTEDEPIVGAELVPTA
jgi:PIN domain nuclease of toxin-antitoxin system